MNRQRSKAHAATPSRGDAELIAKAKSAALQVAENNGGRPLGDMVNTSWRCFSPM